MQVEEYQGNNQDNSDIPLVTRVKCSSGNYASELCASRKCIRQAPICDFSDCKCKVDHKSCSSVELSELIQNMNKSKRKRKDCQYVVLDTFDSLLNLVMKERQKYLDKIAVEEDQEFNTLSGLIKVGSSLISPQLVDNIYQKVGQDSEIEQEQNSLRLVQKFRLDLNRRLESINLKSLYKKSTLKFDLTHHSSLIQISNPRLVTCKSNHKDQQFSTAFLSPCLQELTNHNKVFLFRMKNIPYSVFLGIAHLKNLKENGFVDRGGKNHGCYTMGSYGAAFLHNEQEPIMTEFRMTTGDLIEVEVEPERVGFTNVTQNLKGFYISYQKQKNNPLYLCVQIANRGTQVEFLGEKINI